MVCEQASRHHSKPSAYKHKAFLSVLVSTCSLAACSLQASLLLAEGIQAPNGRLILQSCIKDSVGMVRHAGGCGMQRMSLLEQLLAPL